MTNKPTQKASDKSAELYCVHKIFENTVNANPQRIAVSDNNHTLTFNELNKKANQIAHYLIQSGTKQNECVLLYFNRGADFIISLLGVLKAGAAYIPVIPKFPEERILQICKDAKVKTVITESSLENTVDFADYNVVISNSDTPVFENNSDKNPEIENDLEQLAYVIYTSGTTGVPKGAMIQHKALCSFFYAQQEIYFANDTNLYNVAFSAPLVFDFNVQQWTQILAGHTLVVVPEECRYDGSLFIDFAKKHKLQSIGFTPSEMNMHIAAGMFEQLPQLTHLTIGGEAVTQTLWNEVGRHKHIKAFNTYGPAECTVYVTTARINANDKLSIGKATPNSKLFIVNDKFEKVKDGEFGELIIGGLCIGKGYLNNKKLTEKSYIKTSFGSNELFYRSGDKIRLLEDGNYEYLGRIDRQVKIRGNRIELAEIEHVLKSIKEIENAVCTINDDDPQNKFLIAYIKPQSKTYSKKIKEALGHKLPDYMIPNVYVFVEKFKLSANGKIDTKALPKPTKKDRFCSEIIAPKNQTQKILVELWQTVLKTQNVSISNSFFEIGGHSLLATQVVSHIRKTLNKQLKIRDIFEKPVLENLANYIDTLPENSTELVFKSYGKKLQAPLAYSQIRPWSIFQFKGPNSLYNILIEIKIEGALNTSILNKSLEILVNRHPALRTRFKNTDDNILQVVDKSINFELEISDSSQNERNKVIEELSNLNFDLTSSPLFRFKVLKLADNSFSLFVCMHHTITDGWSMGIFIKELSLVYNSLYRKEKIELPENEFSYTDFAFYQQSYLGSNSYNEHLNFWKKELTGLPELLNLPYDKTRPEEQSFKGNTISFSFSKTLSNNILTYSEKANISPYMTCLAAYFILLKQLSRTDDIVIGSVIANRNYKELENIFGFFSNTILIRALFNNDFTAKEFVEYIRDKNLKAFENQDMPMDKLIDELKPNRSLSYNPMFQVVFNYQNMDLGNLDFPEAKIDISQVHNNTAKVDLTLELHEKDNIISGEIEYAEDLFFEKSVQNYIAYYQNILAEIVSKNDTKISELRLYNQQEKDEYSTSFSFEPVSELFNRTAIKFGNKKAIQFLDKQLSYNQLNKLSNKYANYLQKNHPENIIGISLERSIETIVVILGILKAGKAYLPIDLKYPAERKNLIIEDSELKTLLCSEKIDTEINQITLDELKEKIEDYEDIAPNIKITEDTPAYIIYTSGTTGNPKGVVIGHGTLSYFTQTSRAHYNISEKDTVLQFASVSFDAAIEEIFPTLCYGASLVVRDENMISTNQYFLEKCVDYEITILDLPTAYWHQLVAELDSLETNDFKNIRIVILGGEAVKKSIAKKWFEYFGKSPELINTYGPTEATVVATKHTITSADLQNEIPIGKPIANVNFTIINSHNQAVPTGIPGELCLGGNCLALGYLKNKELTNQKFIKISGKRFYKTGDLVRLKTDGNIDFMGRMDKQVKIRGFRVELNEIENRIRQFGKIKDCVVCAKNIGQNNLDIVTYLVKNSEFKTSELATFLEQNLPDFMVPAYFVFIDEIPLNINNKVDEKALPLPESKDRQIEQGEHKNPETKTQQQVHDVWCKLLKLDELSISDNFFKLGGHSLLAMQMITRLEHIFNKKITLQKIFEYPTIEIFSKYLDKNTTICNFEENKEIQVVDRSKPITLSSSQKRIWFVNQLEGANASYNIPLDFKVSGNFNIEAFKQSLKIIAERQEILRASFSNKNGNPVQTFENKAEIEFVFHNLTEKSPKEAETEYLNISAAAAEHIFDLEKAPLWRSVLVQMLDSSFRILFNFHHIISDGWSVGIFIKELSEIYNSLVNGRELKLKKLTIQYADYAASQQLHNNSDKINKQVDYWCKKLQGAPEIIQFPCDFQRQKFQTFNGGEVRIKFSKTTTLKLKELANENNISLYMLLFGAYVILLHKHSHDTDIVVGTPIANRKNGLTDNLIGIFINNLAIRSNITGDLSIKKFINQLKNNLFEAYQNQEAPFETVLKKLQLKRNLSISPLFQVMFNLLNAHNEQLNFDGTEVDYLDIPRKIAKYDLSLIMSERNDELRGIFEYNSDLHKPSSIERISKHYENIIAFILESFEHKISEIPILTRSEQTLLLTEINNTNSEYPEDKCYHQLFEEAVKEHPQKTAVLFANKQITYEELNKKANQLAAYLRNKQIGENHFVGIYLDRSIEMVIALIAVMKTGAAYIPLDPIYPKDRIKLILDDASPKAIITHKNLFDNLPETSAELIDINNQEIGQSASKNLKLNTKASAVAYQIYTSGSTGKPKGVQIQHSALNNFLLSMAKKPGCTKTDVLLAVTTISFDIAGLELFMPLLAGAKVVVAKQEEARNADLLINLIEKHNPTILQATPVTFKMLLMANWKGSNYLKVLCGGEAFPLDLAQNLNQVCKEVWNMYGPTETTIWSTIKKVEQNNWNGAYETIGFPIDNTQIYVVDEYFKPQPIGVSGELLIGGKGIAKGYYNRPDLNIDRFIDSPFEKGAKLYRTGDRVKFLEDGDLEYLERMDNQVKIRGFRIELGEIETALKSLEYIRDAVIVVKEDSSKNKVLVAYFISKNGTVNQNEIAKEIRKKVPDYMVPGVYTELAEFPITPNGKIDRKALPDPETKSHDTTEIIPPKTKNEKQILEIWKRLLEKDEISVEDDFFALGGHSLLAVNLMVKIEEKTGVRLPLATLFNHTSIRKLAQCIHETDISWKSLVPIKPNGNKNPVYLVHGAGL
ncbi:MAG: amino acid adenylation domain-containing protein, partial [Bacteroidales bacterium]